MFSGIETSDVRDMILDRIIQIQQLDRRWANELEPQTDEIITLLETLYDRTIDIHMKTRSDEYVTNAGIKVKEREYASGNMRIVMEKHNIPEKQQSRIIKVRETAEDE